jgi:hypothetical protein
MKDRCAQLCSRGRQAEPVDSGNLQARATQHHHLHKQMLQLNRSRCVAPTSMSKVHLHKVCPQLVRPAFNGVPLRALHSTAADCAIVMFTVIFGKYDDVSRFAASQRVAHDEMPQAARVCRFLFTDVPRQSNGLWLNVPIAPLPFPDNAARSAHAFKTIPWLLFPSAEWVIYLDGKAVVDPTPLQLVSNVSALSGNAPLTMLRHPLIDSRRYAHGWLEEFMKERAAIDGRRRQGWKRDLRDLDLALSTYCARGDICGLVEVPDSSLMVWHKPADGCAGRRLMWRVALLQCTWLGEVSYLSQREQLSFPLAVKFLHLERVVHYMQPAEYMSWWGWRPHSFEGGGSGDCVRIVPARRPGRVNVVHKTCPGDI